MNNKRIAMFSVHSDPMAIPGTQEAGGQNVYIKFLVKELDKMGWSVDVFTRQDHPNKRHIVNIGNNSRVVRLKAGPISHFPKTRLFEVFDEFYNSFKEFITEHNNSYDIFHGHHWDGGEIALRAKEEFNKPFIHNSHSLGKIRLRTQEQYLWSVNEKEIYEKRFAIEEAIAENADKFISLSETEKRDLESLYQVPTEKIDVIPGAVNLKRFGNLSKEEARDKLGLSKDAYTLLFVGRLEWRKGAGTLISAVSKLKNEIQNIEAVIVGGGITGKFKNEADVKEYKRLLQKAKEGGIEKRVKFMGQVSNGDLPVFYSAADIFVVPSYYEPFGLVALEGMASKVPVIASRKGGLRYTIEDRKSGLLFEPRSDDDLKSKILEIYNSPELRDSLVKNAYNRVTENYSWPMVAERIEKIYLDAIEKSK